MNNCLYKLNIKFLILNQQSDCHFDNKIKNLLYPRPSNYQGFYLFLKKINYFLNLIDLYKFEIISNSNMIENFYYFYSKKKIRLKN